ncbi:MAG: three-Cys-motif partner protein TcmP [Chloroflexi bacterium]|nr:three-Cys-motif partner protein TcmP [Chloroflexota bacterium]
MPREVGEWTKDKLKIVGQYLPAYLDATQRAVQRIYIDAFAGPGTNLVERTGEIIDGSPLIALSARGRRGARGFDHLYFIEKDYDLAAELKSEVELRGEGERATVIPGDVNVELPELMLKIHPRSPTFIFLDTEGIEPSWETVQSLAAWRTELLINFPLGMSINRNPDSAKTEAYFGTSDWRPLWDTSRRSRTSGLIDLYVKRLAALGWEHPVNDPRLVKDDGNRNLYYLLFASKLDIGKRIMDSVFRQPDSSGQARFKMDFPD